MNINLPQTDQAWPPFNIGSQENKVTVLDQTGRVVSTIGPFQQQTFVIRKPAWWKFWQRSPRWERAR